MALGAILLSLPTALFFALYGYAIQGMSIGHGLLLYMTVGTVLMMTCTFLHPNSFTDHR